MDLATLSERLMKKLREETGSSEFPESNISDLEPDPLVSRPQDVRLVQSWEQMRNVERTVRDAERQPNLSDPGSNSCSTVRRHPSKGNGKADRIFVGRVSGGTSEGDHSEASETSGRETSGGNKDLAK